MTYTVPLPLSLDRAQAAAGVGSVDGAGGGLSPAARSGQRLHASRQIGQGRQARRHEECVRFSSRRRSRSRVTENGPFEEDK